MATIDLDAREKEIEARKQFLGKVIPPILELVKTRGTSAVPRGDSGTDMHVLNFEGFSFRMLKDIRIDLGLRRCEFVREGVQVWHHPQNERLTLAPPSDDTLCLDVRWDTAGFGANSCKVKFMAGVRPGGSWTVALEHVAEHWKAIAEHLDRREAQRMTSALAQAARAERVLSESERLGFKD